MTLLSRLPSRPALLGLLFGLTLLTAQSGSAVAVLDGEPISSEEYGAYLIETVGKRPLRGLINRKLVAREAERLGIQLDEGRVQEAFDETWSILLERWEGDAEKAAAELDKQGFSPESYRRLVEGTRRHDLLSDAIVRATRSVTEAAIQEQFEREFGPGGRRVELRHIFLGERQIADALRKTEGGAPTPARIHAELERRVTELLELLAAGGDFETLAREHSHDTRSSKHGGKLTQEASVQLGEAFLSAVRSAAVGLPTGPVFSANGAHLIEVTERVTTRLVDVRELLAEQLRTAPANYVELGELEERLFSAAAVEGL